MESLALERNYLLPETEGEKRQDVGREPSLPSALCRKEKHGPSPPPAPPSLLPRPLPLPSSTRRVPLLLPARARACCTSGAAARLRCQSPAQTNQASWWSPGFVRTAGQLEGEVRLCDRNNHQRCWGQLSAPGNADPAWGLPSWAVL